jgi:hypothetical protein
MLWKVMEFFFYFQFFHSILLNSGNEIKIQRVRQEWIFPFLYRLWWVIKRQKRHGLELINSAVREIFFLPLFPAATWLENILWCWDKKILNFFFFLRQIMEQREAMTALKVQAFTVLCIYLYIYISFFYDTALKNGI